MSQLTASSSAPAPVSPPAMLAISGDGRHIAVLSDGELRLDGTGMLRAPGLVRLAAVDGAIWVIGSTGGESELYRVALDGTVAPPVALGDLGPDVRIAAARRGARCALIEGRAAVLVRDARGGVTVEELGALGADRRVLCDERGIAERRGAAVVLRAGGAGFVLPEDLRPGMLVGGAAVFDGAALLAVIEHRDQRTVLVGDLRARTVRIRIRIAEAEVVAVAESRGLVVLGRGAHVALLDLRAGRCIGERILPAPLAAAAIDRNGERPIVIDVEGRVLELGAALHGGSEDHAPEPEPAPDPEPVIAVPEPREETAPVELVAPASVEIAARTPLHALCAAGSGVRLTREELDAYLEDVRALVVAYGNAAAGRVELAAELGLSALAGSVLWFAAAPLVWGELARMYGDVKADPARPLVDEHLIAQDLEAWLEQDERD